MDKVIFIRGKEYPSEVLDRSMFIKERDSLKFQVCKSLNGETDGGNDVSNKSDFEKNESDGSKI